MTDLSALPLSVAGERVAWLLDQVRHGVPASDDELATMMAGDNPRGVLTHVARSLEGGSITDVDSPSELEVILTLACPRDRYWQLGCRVRDSAPQRITDVHLDRVLAPGMEIRFATEEDNDDLVAVSRATSIVLREASVVVDPGDDYFAAMRLMEEWTALVVTDNGRVVGVQCACSYPGMYGGEYSRISQILHTRFHPDYARMGLWSLIQTRMLSAGRQRAAAMAAGEAQAITGDGPLPEGERPPPTVLNGIAYVSVDNEAVHRLYAGVKPWRAQPFRATIPCATTSGRNAIARRAAETDVDHITAVLNECHEGEELYLPHTVSSYRRRMTGAPELYTWSDVFVSDDAVVGVWESPETRVRTEGGTTTRSRRALVLDHGFRLGAEDAFERVLRQAAAEAGEAGYDHLSIFSSAASPGAAVVRALADRIEPYDIIVPFSSEPDGAADRGVYVDQIYF